MIFTHTNLTFSSLQWGWPRYRLGPSRGVQYTVYVCTHVHLLSKAGNRKLKDLCSIIARVLVKGDVSAGDGSSRQVPGLHPGPRPRGHQQMVSQNCHQRCCGPSGPVYGWTVVKPLYGCCLDCCILSWVEISELFTGAEGLSQIKSSPPPSCHGWEELIRLKSSVPVETSKISTLMVVICIL